MTGLEIRRFEVYLRRHHPLVALIMAYDDAHRGDWTQRRRERHAAIVESRAHQ